MKVALPRTLLLKVADYLDNYADEWEASFWDYTKDCVTPRQMRLEVERVRKWVGQIRQACERKP